MSRGRQTARGQHQRHNALRLSLAELKSHYSAFRMAKHVAHRQALRIENGRKSVYRIVQDRHVGGNGGRN